MSGHVESLKLYYGIFTALMVLLAVTVAVAYVSLPGFLNIVVAMSIAVVKMVLVIMYFMHVRHNPKIIWVCAGAGFFWLALMLVILMTDYFGRYWMPGPSGWS